MASSVASPAMDTGQEQKEMVPQAGHIQGVHIEDRLPTVHSNRGYPAPELSTYRVSFRNKTEIYFLVTG